MSGYPKIQSYIGADSTGYGNSNTGGALDLTGNLLIVLKTGKGDLGTIITYNIDTGAEVNFATATTITGSSSHNITKIWTITSAGLIVMETDTTNDGSSILSSIDQTTLRVVSVWNANGPTLGGYTLQFLVPMLSPDSINFVFGADIDSGFSVFEADGAVMQFAGHAFATDEPFSSSCVGQTKNVVYTACHHTYSTSSPVGFYKTTVSSGAGGFNVAGWPGTGNANIASTKIGTMSPSGVDATWTTFSNVSLLGVDADDGNIIVQFSTLDVVTNKNYVAKINAATLAIIWQTAGVTASAVVSQPNNALVWTTTADLHSLALSTGTHTVTTPYGEPSVDWSQLGQFYDYHKNSIFTWGQYTDGGEPPYRVTGTTSWATDEWYRIILGNPAVAATQPYYLERMTQLFDDNVPDDEHFFVDSGVVPPSARLATLAADGFDGVRCYGMDLLTTFGATKVAGVLGGMDIGDSRSAANGIVDFAFSGTFTLAYVQSFGATTFPALMLDQYQVAIDSGTQDGASHQLYYVAPFMVGFPYTSQAQLLRPNHGEDAGAKEGPAMGKVRRNHKYSALLYRTQNITFGTDFTIQRPAPLNQPNGTAIAQPTLFSGTIRNTIDDDYSTDGMIAFEQTRPSPGTILAVSGNIQTQDE